jgi:hypothetical protein
MATIFWINKEIAREMDGTLFSSEKALLLSYLMFII